MIRNPHVITWLVAVGVFLFSWQATAVEGAQSMKTLFDFRQASAAEGWRGINDTVMGGVSRGSMTAATGTAIFAGVLSLENNGGFASVRSEPADFQLAGATGLELRLRGDGKRYKLCVRQDANFDGVLYQSTFDTHAGKWTNVRVRLGDMVATYHGRVLKKEPAVDPKRIKTVGLMIADRQPGDFRLEIESITALGPDSATSEKR